MNKKIVLLSAMLLFVSILLAACGDETGSGNNEETSAEGTEETGKTKEEAEPLRLGTGSEGGTYLNLGNEIAGVLNENVELEGFNVEAVSTDASIANMEGIRDGELALGMTVDVTALNALGNGTVQGDSGDFDKPVDNFGFLGYLYPEIWHIVTTEGTGITSMRDLEGKTINLGPPKSTTNEVGKSLLSDHGLEEDDYEISKQGFGESFSSLLDGDIDVLVALLGEPSESITELSAEHDLVLLPMEEESVDALHERINEGSDRGFDIDDRYDIPAESYDFIDKPINTLQDDAILVGSTELIDEETGYEITKQLYENADSMDHPQAQYMTRENMTNSVRGEMPIHPGAKRYFEEEGLLDED
ncbi:TAXI family TRAP transporter solute-binding subunit [Salibacterium sp. K-3]